MLSNWTLEKFKPHLGDTFAVSPLPGESVALVLKEAELLNMPEVPREKDPPRKPFALHFGGPLSPILPQRIYSFSHPALGDFEMFIVPIGPREGGMIYEAIFT
jgi:hypothetical protein